MGYLAKIMGLVAVALLLGGCEFKLFDPKGPISDIQMTLIIISTIIMLLIVIPVTFMGMYFPFRYKKGNKTEEYKPDWEHSTRIEVIVWTVPIIIILVLGIITYRTSFSLDPRKPVESEEPGMVVQVVALNWKWLFIFPEQEIATVNELVFPVNTTVEYLVTSDTTMNSFYIPNLGSQIYAMSGMENRVHLVADEIGDYAGFSANYSGFGFSGMKFTAKARSEEDFKAWVAEVKATNNPLSDVVFETLRENSRDVKPIRYSSVNPLLFSDIIEQYAGELNGR